MKTNIETKSQRKEEFQHAIVFSIIFIVIATTILFVYYNNVIDKNHEISEEQQFAELNLISSQFLNKISQSINTIELLNNSKTVKDFLISNENKLVFQDLLISITSEMKQYHQVRLLDVDGNELIRINRNPDQTLDLVSESDLQNKSHRYYFKESILLKPDEVYISPFDLNVENGVIEEPHNPMLRFGKSIYKNDVPIGIFMVNLSGQLLLNDLTNEIIHSYDTFYLLNEDGYYLVNEDPDKTFAFMFNDKLSLGFFSDYPEIWQNLKEGKNHVSSDLGHFYSEKIYLEDTNDKPYYFIMHVSESYMSDLDTDSKKILVELALIVYPLILMVAWSFAIIRVKNKWYKKKLVEGATRDSLTGLFNHRMIIQLIEEFISVSRMSDLPLTIIFIDVNDLKSVNDNYGHKMGDQMLIDAAEILEDQVRLSDPVSRLGGDEFLIALPNCDIEIAKRLMTKVNLLFSQKGLEHVQKTWTMSYGITSLEPDDDLHILINRADRLMYEHKSFMKSKKK